MHIKSCAKLIFLFNFENRIVAKLQTPRINDESNPLVAGDPYVEVYLDPNCKHKITIKASLGEMWAQMVRIFLGIC